MYFTLLPENYVLLDEDSLDSCLVPILKTLFIKNNSNNDDTFIQLHLSSDEVSIILPEKNLANFTSIRYTPPYRAIRVDTANPGLEEAGILAEVTALFKSAAISILSVSTFRYNYIFIQTTDLPAFIQLINKNKDTVHFEDTS